VDRVSRRCLVNRGGQLLGSCGGHIGVARRDGIPELPEVGLDRRLVPQILESLPLSDTNALSLLLGISQPLLPPVFPSKSQQFSIALAHGQ
jgi:hypothetical protein